MSTQTLITSTTVVRGSIIGKDALTLKGQIEGSVQLDGDLSVQQDGRIIGNVTARSVIVDGAIRGDVEATVYLRLSKTARIIGDLTSPQVLIEDGAQIRGAVDIGSSQQSAVKRGKAENTEESAGASDAVELPEGTTGRKVKVKKR